MTRKAKAFWSGSLAPVITLWVWVFLAWVLGGFLAMDYWTAFVFFTGPAIVVGGLAGMIASGCTSGPPMSRKAKAGLIGFYAPVILWSGWVMLWYVAFVRSDPGWADRATSMGTLLSPLFVWGPSLLLGLLIAVIARSLTRNKPDSLPCGKCGYSLVGLTSDKCPECGHTVRSTAPS